MVSIKISLIIGMGIGQLYQSVLRELSSTIYTVDTNPDKNADFLSVNEAIDYLTKNNVAPQPIDTVHICTPNWTHGAIAQQVAPYAKIVFIEKPGVQNEDHLNKLHNMFPATRFMMVKNNMWRDNIDEMRKVADSAIGIHLNWLNNDRVPNPGTWFTTKDLAFGGVSRDLMPHLLSFIVAFFPNRYRTLDITGNGKERSWNLFELTETDYGIVDLNGTYNVDDMAWLDFNLFNSEGVPEKYIRLEADWRTLEGDERNIVFETATGVISFEFGLCPESAYKNMIQDCMDNIDDTSFWAEQYDIDLWIHKMVAEI